MSGSTSDAHCSASAIRSEAGVDPALVTHYFGSKQRLFVEVRAERRATLTGSQVVGLVMARYVIGLEPLASTPPDEVAAALAPTLQRYLAGPL